MLTLSSPGRAYDDTSQCDVVSPSTHWKSRKSVHCAMKQSSGFNFPLYFRLTRPFSFDQSSSWELILRLCVWFLWRVVHTVQVGLKMCELVHMNEDRSQEG